MDWFLTIFLTAVVGGLGYLFYYLLTQRRKEQAENTLWQEHLKQQHEELLSTQTKEADEKFSQEFDVGAFETPFELVKEYEEEKKKDAKSDKCRALLLGRACEVVRRAERIERAVKPINEVINAQPNPKQVQDRLMNGVKSMENEMKAVREEANAISSGWGDIVIQQAADLTLNAWRRKEMIKRAQQQQQQQQAKKKDSALSDSTSSSPAKPDEPFDPIAPSTSTDDPMPLGRRFARDVEVNAPTPPIAELIRLAQHICHSPEKLKANALQHFRSTFDVDAFKPEYPAKKEYEEGKAADRWSTDELRKELRKRALDAVKRAARISKAVPPINMALQQNRVPDPQVIQQELQAGVNSLNGEMGDIVAEANVLAPGWGQVIMAEAQKLFEVASKAEAEKQAKVKAKEDEENKKQKEKEESEKAFAELMKEEEGKNKKKEKK